MPDVFDVVVIGGGRTGLTVAYALGALGKRALDDFVVFDASARPGGSWGASWRELRLRDVAALVAPPGLTELGLGRWDEATDRSVREVRRDEFARYEDAFDLGVTRRARVLRVERRQRAPELAVTVDVAGRSRTVLARAVVSATGHRSTPFVPAIAGASGFAGVLEHSAHLDSVAPFAGRRVLLVGAGDEADALAASLSAVGAEPFRAGLERVPAERSIVGGDATDTAHLLRRLEPSGARFADGLVRPFDTVLLATGRRRALRHLAPLRLRDVHRGIVERDGWSRSDPRIGFAGVEPSLPPAIALDRALELVEQRADPPVEPGRRSR